MSFNNINFITKKHVLIITNQGNLIAAMDLFNKLGTNGYEKRSLLLMPNDMSKDEHSLITSAAIYKSDEVIKMID